MSSRATADLQAAARRFSLFTAVALLALLNLVLGLELAKGWLWPLIFLLPLLALGLWDLVQPAHSLMRNALVGANLRSEIRLAASGKIVGGFSMAANLALGADWCNAARAFMFALGCVQSMRCHTNRCPTGVTTNDPALQRGLVVALKAQRVAGFQHHTVEALAELVAAAGLLHRRI